jgi:hypothetical protein
MTRMEVLAKYGETSLCNDELGVGLVKFKCQKFRVSHHLHLEKVQVNGHRVTVCWEGKLGAWCAE